ncbi:MAG: hypothetical protein ACRDMX_00990, partial [Solirubrobacteraceae bacterium]
MDDNDHHETNVVNLHRGDDLDSRRREQIASTIFADEDENYTFSHGNLVPPAPAAPSIEPEAPDDPFFAEQLRQVRPHAAPPTATESAQQQSETDAYFERLASQSATDMARRLHEGAEHADRPAGSAALALSDATPAHRRPERSRIGIRLRARRGLSIALSASVAVLAAAVLLVVVLPSRAPVRAPGRNVGRPLSSIFDLRDSLARLHATAAGVDGARARADHAAKVRSTRADRRTHGARSVGRRSHSQSSTATHHALRPANTTAADTTSQQAPQTPASASTQPPT